MAFEFHLPDLAEGMAEAEVVSWKVKEGDKVALDQPIVEVMSDKATVEIPSPRAGILAKQNYAEGAVCKVGAVLFVIEEEGSASAGAGTEASSGKNGARASASAGHEMTKKAPAPARPVVQAVGAVAASPADVRATPATRRLARQLNVDLAAVPATGPKARVTTEDVKRFADGGTADVTTRMPIRRAADIEDVTKTIRLKAQPPGSEPAVTRSMSVSTVVPAPVPAAALAPAAARREPVAIARVPGDERLPFRGLRRKIAENMTRSAFTATHFTYVEEVDVEELVAVRERVKPRADERGIKLTYLPFIIKAVVAGLKQFPQLNSQLDEAAQEIIRKGAYHIGIAFQSPKGLMVTVVRNADQLSIFQVAQEVARLAKAGEEGRATPEELSGSTFTISSLGKLGGLMATPIINFPEVGILGVHKIEQRAVVMDGHVVPRWRMNLSISLDHRVVDGYDGAMFLQEVKKLLEDPTGMFMEMV